MRLSIRTVATTALLVTATFTGCAAPTESADTPASSSPASGPTAASVPAAAEALLGEYGLDGMDAVEVIDHLDRLGGTQRPADLMASVRPDQLVLSAGSEEFPLDLPGDLFYLSVAPYVDQTHECFYHSLTTCQGELASAAVQVEIVDETNGQVLVDEIRTTFENGFTGFWLPRDIEGTLRVTHDGRTGEVGFATDEDAPTCLTTLQLV